MHIDKDPYYYQDITEINSINPKFLIVDFSSEERTFLIKIIGEHNIEKLGLRLGLFLSSKDDRLPPRLMEKNYLD